MRPWRRIAIRILTVAALIYLGLALVLALLQTKFIFPGSASQGQKHAIVRPFAGGEIVELKTPEGEKVAALFGAAMMPDGRPHPDAAHRPTILYFYGNGMCMADCEGEFLKLRRRGFNVIIPDFLGYGMSSGKPSEQGVYATADACFDHLLKRGDIDPARIVPVGWSLGSAAAIYLASTRAIPCLVTISAFTSMSDMAKKLVPFMPTSLILRHHFENEKKLKGIRVPVFIGHGTRDDIVPFEMPKKLAAAAEGHVVKYNVEGGRHNDVFDVGGGPFLDAIEQFIDAEARP